MLLHRSYVIAVGIDLVALAHLAFERRLTGAPARRSLHQSRSALAVGTASAIVTIALVYLLLRTH